MACMSTLLVHCPRVVGRYDNPSVSTWRIHGSSFSEMFRDTCFSPFRTALRTRNSRQDLGTAPTRTKNASSTSQCSSSTCYSCKTASGTYATTAEPFIKHHRPSPSNRSEIRPPCSSRSPTISRFVRSDGLDCRVSQKKLQSRINPLTGFQSGVAVGSSIGHAIGGLFGGGSSSAATETQPADTGITGQSVGAGYQDNNWGPRSCETDAKSFTKCLDENGGNMQICGWYLDQLVRQRYIYSQACSRLTAGLQKACQAAASSY